MKNFFIAIFAALFLLTVSSVFIVKEGQRTIAFQFKKIKRCLDVQLGTAVVVEGDL